MSDTNVTPAAESPGLLSIGMDFLADYTMALVKAPADLFSKAVVAAEKRFGNGNGEIKKDTAITLAANTLISVAPGLLERWRPEIVAVIDGPVEAAVADLNAILKRQVAPAVAPSADSGS